ncbi:MAG: RCC1 domain-containing protein [Polyangia bacterium]
MSHICAVLETGTIRCWGDNEVGQLGYGDDVEDEIGDDEVPASLCEVPVI